MRLSSTPATTALVACTAICWLAAQLLDLQDVSERWGAFVPARFAKVGSLGTLAWFTPLTATLLHANLMHLGFNLLMLGFCGSFVELALRPLRTLILYVAGAYAAAFAQYLIDPNSVVPMIGASGALSAFVGGYAMLFGEKRQFSGNWALDRTVNILWLASAWIAVQLLIGFATSGGPNGIAIFAHIGGFIAGLVLAQPLLLWRYHKA